MVDVRRIERSDRASRRALSRPHLHRRPNAPRRSAAPERVETYAKRFAAKEACAKALGTGFRSGVFWRDMGVVNLPSGRPTMKLTGGALKRLQAITPAGCEAQIDVSLTDEGPVAQAFVIISARAASIGMKPGNAIRPSAYTAAAAFLIARRGWQPLQGRGATGAVDLKFLRLRRKSE